mgnify:FL=1
MRESDLWPGLQRYWHPVAFSEEVGEKPLAVFRLGGPRPRGVHDLGRSNNNPYP